MKRCKMMSEDQHRETGQALIDARQRVLDVIRRTLNRRVPAPVIDLALKVDRQLFALSLRLCDSLGERGHALYPLDVPSAPSAVPQGSPKRLTPEEHHAVGGELYELRCQLMDLGVMVSNAFPKSSPVGRAAFVPHRAIDSLRSKLDDLFCQQYPVQFDTKAYYPGTSVLAARPTLPNAVSDALPPLVPPSSTIASRVANVSQTAPLHFNQEFHHEN